MAPIKLTNIVALLMVPLLQPKRRPPARLAIPVPERAVSVPKRHREPGRRDGEQPSKLGSTRAIG